MRMVFGLTAGFVLGLLVSLVGFAVAKQPPPIVIELGPVMPTPVPSPRQADRIRMITSFTLQNKPDGKSIITFEATDFAKAGQFIGTDTDQITKDDESAYRVIASEVYSLVEPKKKLRPLRDRIVQQVRVLELDLLDYVEQAGPPREREPVTAPGSGQRR